jgi:hypothetical protein
MGWTKHAGYILNGNCEKGRALIETERLWLWLGEHRDPEAVSESMLTLE